MTLTAPTIDEVASLLSGLLGRQVQATVAPTGQLHPATLCGLVDDSNTVISVIAADLEFAHRTGAAIAMMPLASADEVGYGQPDQDLIENYHEVANVFSRAVNERSPSRLRLDPGLDHDRSELVGVIQAGTGAVYSVEVAGYGTGHVAVYMS